jgi:hypothetical protein
LSELNELIEDEQTRPEIQEAAQMDKEKFKHAL